MFRLYVFTCCLQRIFYNRKKIPFPRFFFAGWKKSHLLEFFCWCKGKNPIFWVHRVHQWGHQWTKKRVVIYTDNVSYQADLFKQTFRSRAFRLLCQILLLAAQLDILLEPIWIPGHTNILADALSQFNFEQIANICPHWQPYFRNHHPPSIVGNRQYHT